MRDWTDKQFKDAGWKWLLRYEGRAMACSVSPFDGARWLEEGVGEVISLDLVE